MFGRRLRLSCAVALVVAAGTLGAQGRLISLDDARGLRVKADKMYADAKYREAFQAYDRASGADDRELVASSIKGMIRSALRLSSFDIAMREAEGLKEAMGNDLETQTLYADSLWGNGFFDEAEATYTTVLKEHPDSPRAHFGMARSLVTRGRTEEALAEVQRAADGAPGDPDVLALIGEVYERMYRFEDAARAYEAYVSQLPPRIRDNSDVAVLKIKLLRSFGDRTPISIDNQDTMPLHTVPFRLQNKKILFDGAINGHKLQFVLDTGAERTAVLRDTADRVGVRGIIQSDITGVGAPGLRRLSVGRADTLTIGSLTIRNLPISIRHDKMPGVPDWQNTMFSPLALGLSVIVDYQHQQLTLGRRLPTEPADVTMPMRVYRLPMVRGILNNTHPAYFIVDTGGELISISRGVATDLAMAPTTRRIRLKVWGVTGLDPDAFLLPGVDLNFSDIHYRKQGVAVLNLRAPSVLLGFEVGGILGHRFLGGYRVAMDMQRGELRLSKFN